MAAEHRPPWVTLFYYHFQSASSSPSCPSPDSFIISPWFDFSCVPARSSTTVKLELLPLTDGIISLDTLQISVKEKGTDPGPSSQFFMFMHHQIKKKNCLSRKINNPQSFLDTLQSFNSIQSICMAETLYFRSIARPRPSILKKTLLYFQCMLLRNWWVLRVFGTAFYVHTRQIHGASALVLICPKKTIPLPG